MRLTITTPIVFSSRKWIPPALAALVFALLSLAILPYPGLQDDEVLFTYPLYQGGGALFSTKVFGARIPLMLMGYLGTFKTWLYAGIFEFFPPSRWSVRVPMVFAGVITILLTWIFVRRLAGHRAAAFAVALLSTDAVFIVTNTFDWGPVALQHACLMGGLVAIQTWLRNESRWMLILAFFLWGLGLWDKALFIWPLAGLSVATVCVYPKEVRRHLQVRSLAIAGVALLFGALPLVCYNLAHRGDTASANTKLSVGEIPRKVQELEKTLDGSALLGVIAATEAGPITQTPVSIADRLSVSLRRISGERTHNWMLPAIMASIFAMVFFVRAPMRRLLIFLSIAMSVTWLEMAANVGTGGSAHHVILLWPFPCIFVGVALSEAAERAPRLTHAMTGLVAVLVCANLLNANEYLADLALNGALGGWTDASYRLAGALVTYKSEPIGIVDWGYLNGLRMMYDGELNMTVVTDFVRKPVMTDEDRRQLLKIVDAPGSVFIQHTDDNQLYAGVNDQMRSAALALGYSEQILRVVHDNQGRPVFEIFRFAKGQHVGL